MDKVPDARFEGGLWCHEVLDVLDAFVAGTLSPEQRAAADAHLTACGHCASFGGVYGQVVDVLHKTLCEAAPLDSERTERLNERLKRLTEE